MQIDDKEYTVKLTNILLEFAMDVINMDRGKTNPTYGELTGKPANAIKELNKEMLK